MKTLQAFRTFLSRLQSDDAPMPSLFVGHGSPMNGISDNVFTQNWVTLGETLPVPKAIAVISAHWLTRGTHVTAMEFPRTLHDFGGFPESLYQVQYPAPGDPMLARSIADTVRTAPIAMHHEWGLDHGVWTVIRHIYPNATIPVVQISIDYTKEPEYHFALANELKQWREKGVLIVGSGNMVHNLRMIKWDALDEPGFGFDWALSVNERFKQMIREENNEALIHYADMGPEAVMAIPTPEHFIPLLYTLGTRRNNDQLLFFNDQAVGGSITMTSLLMA